MLIFSNLDEIPAGQFARGSAIAIGKFDGVHRGHRALLARVTETAAERGLDPVVFTFEENPLSFLRPDLRPIPIMSRDQRLEALSEFGATACVILPFDAELAAVSAEDFVEQILVGRLRLRHLSVGEDFRFGHRGTGDVTLLAVLAEKFGFSLDVLANVEAPELGRISSSSVRTAIQSGEVALAGQMMDRPVAVRGEVVRGDARGRELGFPTANLGSEIDGLVPGDGVYAGWAIVDDARHQAAISVGANITFEPEGKPRVEAFLLDFEGDLYGKRIEVQFVQRLRGMVAFAGIDALVDRMQEDVRETREILAQS